MLGLSTSIISNNLKSKFCITFYCLQQVAEVKDMLKKTVYNSYANRLIFFKYLKYINLNYILIISLFYDNTSTTIIEICLDLLAHFVCDSTQMTCDSKQ